MTIEFEGNTYQSSYTRPDIPYTVYNHDKYLLLVPRKVEKIHKEFPKFATPSQAERRFTLQVSDVMSKRYRDACGEELKFDGKLVSFGFEEDEGVVVAALLPGSDMIAYWPFRDMLNGDEMTIRKHFTDQSSSPMDSFRMMNFDLQEAA